MFDHPVVTALVAAPGSYAGRGDGSESGPFVGRMIVAPLPSGQGVRLEYEAWSHAELLQHAEHSLLGYGPDGQATLVVAHSESPVVSVMTETEPGRWTAPRGGGPYEQAVVIEVPEAGRIIYSWWWAPAGEELVERSRADLLRS